MEKTLRLKVGLSQLGNSKGFYIPTGLLKLTGWNDQDEFYLELKDGKITIEKVKN